MINVIYLARLAEELNTEHERLDLIFSDSEALLIYLRSRGAPWDQALANGKVYKIAVNNVIQHNIATLHDGDTVALLPPVTGG